MTPQPSQSDALASVAALVVVMAAIAALTARFGVSPLVAIVCALIAMVGTWRFLAPRAEGSATQTAGAGSSGTKSDQISFTRLPDEGLSPVGASGVASAGAAAVGATGMVGAVKAMDGAPADADAAAPVVPAPEIDEIGWLPDSKPDSLGGEGRLPDGAQTLSINPPEEWSAATSGAYSLGQFEVRGASRIGTDHALLDEDRQDDFVVARAGGNKFLIVVLANGVRTADNAHLGAHWASRLLARNIELHLRDGVPGIEKMLDRTRTDLQGVFSDHFDDDTKLRSIATRLVGLIAPVDGGPAAGFRVGDGELLLEGPLGWSSVFGEAPPTEANMVFPRVSKAEVVSIDCSDGTLLLASDGVHRALSESDELAAAFSTRCRHVLTEHDFDQLLDFDMESAREDRTAVGVWFRTT